MPVEQVNEARGEAVWYQLYPTNDWDVGKALVTRAERAGCQVLVLTVDNLGNNRLTQERAAREDSRPCQACHTIQGPRYFVTRPMFAGLDLARATRLTPHDWNWDYVKRLKDHARMRLVLKGIVTRDDAELAVAHGVDGLIVSNHGGRSEDSGFRRRTDVFKALALGAKAVCIGRPYVWGLAVFGEPGVARTFELLGRELELIMRQAGTRSLADIGPSFVIDRGRWLTRSRVNQPRAAPRERAAQGRRASGATRSRGSHAQGGRRPLAIVAMSPTSERRSAEWDRQRR